MGRKTENRMVIRASNNPGARGHAWRATTCAGMTLLELVAATAIFSLVAGAGYGALSQGLMIQDRLQAQGRFWQRLEAVFNLVHSDFEQVIDRASRGSSNPFIGHEQGSRTRYGYLLEFIRGGQTAFREGPVSPFLRVAYRLEDGNLYRRTWWHSDLPYGTQADETLLIDDIEAIGFRYLDYPGGWVRRWPRSYAGDSSPLPGAVEVTMTLHGHGPFTWLFHVGPPRP